MNGVVWFMLCSCWNDSFCRICGVVLVIGLVGVGWCLIFVKWLKLC